MPSWMKRFGVLFQLREFSPTCLFDQQYLFEAPVPLPVSMAVLGFSILMAPLFCPSLLPLPLPGSPRVQLLPITGLQDDGPGGLLEHLNWRGL